ncbi:MAG: sulfatase-like hydrolase/transferase [Candidatus Hydrogenedentes bacterium]|nr:sulfatase-like hydrolase/transferase [Candidatus Hydrogenedentota bacterium]
MIFVYAITLGISSGVTGLFARQALGEQGYVPGLTPGLMVACGVAATYAGLQLLYVGLVRFTWPTKTNWPLLGECLSHGAVAAFLPYLARFDVNWPHPALNDFESLIYFAAFAGIHATLKLVGFYAILRSESGPRAWNVAWMASGMPLLLAGFIMFEVWAGSVEKARPKAPEEVQTYRVGTAYASARALPEGSVLTTNATASIGECLMIGCANPPETALEDALEVAYLTIEMRGDTTTQFSGSIDLAAGEWSYLQIPAEDVPRKMTTCVVRWSTEKESKWRKAVGVLPVLTSDRTLLIDGPHVRRMQGNESNPSLVLIVVDGLGADRVSSMGSAKGTTPNLERIGAAALTYPLTYAPAPEAAASCMTLLTGVSPLRHGYLGDRAGPLPKELKTISEALRGERYATAAFTEGEGWGDLVHGRGFERGFDTFDDGYIAEPPAASVQLDPNAPGPAMGSSETLSKARRWFDAHKDTNYFLLVRLTDLRNPRSRELHARSLLPDLASATPSALYNAAVQYLDREVGQFIGHVRNAQGAKTCIVVTSTRGSYLPDDTVLADWSLRVPFVLSAPGVTAAKRSELTGLEDVASTLARMMHVTLGPYASTADLINAPVSREPISMVGNPLMLSIRNAKLRLVWSTQREPFTMRAVGPPAAAALYDLTNVRAGAPMRDISSRSPQATKNWTDKLDQYFIMQCEGWQTAAAP